MDENEIQQTLKRRLDTANQLIIEQQKQIERLAAENALLTAEKRQWEQSKAMQDDIVRQSLGNFNEMYQNQVGIIQELKNRLNKYEGE